MTTTNTPLPAVATTTAPDLDLDTLRDKYDLAFTVDGKLVQVKKVLSPQDLNNLDSDDDGLNLTPFKDKIGHAKDVVLSNTVDQVVETVKDIKPAAATVKARMSRRHQERLEARAERKAEREAEKAERLARRKAAHAIINGETEPAV